MNNEYDFGHNNDLEADKEESITDILNGIRHAVIRIANEIEKEYTS